MFTLRLSFYMFAWLFVYEPISLLYKNICILVYLNVIVIEVLYICVERK